MHWLGALAIGLSIAGTTVQAADVYYRWLDDRGNPVHSDRPPPTGTPYEVVSSKTTQVRRVAEEADRTQSDAVEEAGEGRARTYLTQMCRAAGQCQNRRPRRLDFGAS